MPDIFDASAVKKSSQSSDVADSSGGDSTAVEDAEQSDVTAQMTQFEKVHPNRSPLGAFLAQPPNTFFDSQTHQEKILLMLRQHPITQLGRVIIIIILAILPTFFRLLPFLTLLPGHFQIIVYLAWYFLVMGFTLETFLDWFFNVWIVTDERIIDVEFLSLLFKHVSYTQLDRIEDVTATTAGAFGSIFNYGHVLIQTAGATDQFEFVNVPQPSEVAEFINQMLVDEQKEGMITHRV